MVKKMLLDLTKDDNSFQNELIVSGDFFGFNIHFDGKKD